MHLKVLKIEENKKVTKNVEHSNEKGFKVLVSCAKKNCYDLIHMCRKCQIKRDLRMLIIWKEYTRCLFLGMNEIVGALVGL